jgi:hypothetical protein
MSGIASQRGEAAARVEQHEDDRASPAAADPLARLVKPDARGQGVNAIRYLRTSMELQ